MPMLLVNLLVQMNFLVLVIKGMLEMAPIVLVSWFQNLSRIFGVFWAVWSSTKRYVLLQNIFCNLIHILYSEDKITFFAPIFWEQQQALTFVHFSTFKTFVLDGMSKQGEGISKGSVNVLCSLLKKAVFIKSNINCSTLRILKLP